MRSKALPPARAQGHIVPFLEAAALFAALCIFARTAALMLAAAITAPLPMAETLFWLGRQSAQEQPASSVQVEAAPDSTPEAAASSLPQAVQARAAPWAVALPVRALRAAGQTLPCRSCR